MKIMSKAAKVSLMVLFAALLSLVYIQHVRAVSNADAQGTWLFYGLAANEGWMYGNFTNDNAGNITDGVANFVGEPPVTLGGDHFVFPDGALFGEFIDTSMSMGDIEFEGALNSTTDTIAFVTNEFDPGFMDLYGFGGALKPATGLVNNDFAGTWDLVALISSIGADNTVIGDVIFDNGGIVTGGVLTVTAFDPGGPPWYPQFPVTITGGTYTINGGETFNASLITNDPNTTINIVNGALGTARNDSAFVFTVNDANQSPTAHHHGFGVLRKNGVTSFLPADFSGLWRMSMLSVDQGEDMWHRGIVIGDGAGNLVDVIVSNDQDEAFGIDSGTGTYSIDSDGFITAAMTFLDPLPDTINFAGAMNGQKNIAAMLIDNELSMNLMTKSSNNNLFGIYGIINYAGVEDGDVFIKVFDGPNPATANLVAYTGIFVQGVYGITSDINGLALTPGDYYVFAFMDSMDIVNDLASMKPDKCVDPIGAFPANPITLGNVSFSDRFARADITLIDTTSPMITADIDGNGQDEVIIDFGPQFGIWIWLNDATWVKLHNLSSSFMTSGDLDGNGRQDIIIDFGEDFGIWIWLNNTSWVKLHDLTQRMMGAEDINNDGFDELVIDFGPDYGIWIYYPLTDTWKKLHALSSDYLLASEDIDGDPAFKGDIVIDFGDPYGIWMWLNDASWVKLHALNPGCPEAISNGDVDGVGTEEITIDFKDGRGIWTYNASSTNSWNKLHSLSAESIAAGDIDGVDQADDLIVDFGGPNGIWVWLNDTSWGKLHTLNPEWMVTGDLDGEGRQDIVIDFGDPFGVWVRYNNATWTKLHNLSP